MVPSSQDILAGSAPKLGGEDEKGEAVDENAVLLEELSAGLLDQLPAMLPNIDQLSSKADPAEVSGSGTCTPPAASVASTQRAPPSTTCKANQEQRTAVAEVVGVDHAGAACVEEVDLEFLEDGNLDLLPLPPPATACVVDTDEADVCPHCAGERVGFGRYQDRDKPRGTNPLGLWNRKHGYKGPPYCKACSESFRSHLLRPGRNPRNGCSRMQPCADCVKVLAYFGDLTPADVFARFDADRIDRGAEHQQSAAPESQRWGFPRSAPTRTPVPGSNDLGLHSPRTLRNSKRRRLSVSAVAVALCIVGTVSNSWQQSSLSRQQGNTHMEAARQLRSINESSAAALAGGMAFEMLFNGNGNSTEAQVCCSTCCNKLPGVPSWVPLRYLFPYMATDYSAIAEPSLSALSTAHYAERFADHLAVFEEARDYYAGSHWDLQYEHQGTLRPLRVATCEWTRAFNALTSPPKAALGWILSKLNPEYIPAAVQTTLTAESLPVGSAEEALQKLAEDGETLQDGWTGLRDNSSRGKDRSERRRLLPSPPHMRTGLVLSTCTTTLVIASCVGTLVGWRRNWKGRIALAATAHFVVRPMLGLVLAGLADVLDPSLDFGIRHEM